jgi:hypothetical protein
MLRGLRCRFPWLGGGCGAPCAPCNPVGRGRRGPDWAGVAVITRAEVVSGGIRLPPQHRRSRCCAPPDHPAPLLGRYHERRPGRRAAERVDPASMPHWTPIHAATLPARILRLRTEDDRIGASRVERSRRTDRRLVSRSMASGTGPLDRARGTALRRSSLRSGSTRATPTVVGDDEPLVVSRRPPLGVISPRARSWFAAWETDPAATSDTRGESRIGRPAVGTRCDAGHRHRSGSGSPRWPVRISPGVGPVGGTSPRAVAS